MQFFVESAAVVVRSYVNTGYSELYTCHVPFLSLIRLSAIVPSYIGAVDIGFNATGVKWLQ